MFKETVLKRFGWAMVALAVVLSLGLWGQRMASEDGYKKVNISVNYTDLLSLANANGLSNESLAMMFQERSVSSVLFKEISIGDLEREGKVALMLGRALVNAPFYGQVAGEIPINDANLYVCILDQSYERQIVEHLVVKSKGATYFAGDVGVVQVPVTIANSNAEKDSNLRSVVELGVGFDYEGMQEMANMGLGVIPQVRSWVAPTDEALRYVTNELKMVPNLSHILFNDKEIPGYPDGIRAMADLLKVEGKPIAPVATIEFSDQKGLSQLGVLLDKDVIRLHTIANNEMSKYTVDEAMDRWMLAVKERNMRSLLVRFFEMNTPSISLNKNLDYLAQLEAGLQESGYELTKQYEKPQSIQVNSVFLMLIGLGVAAGVMLVLLNMGLPRLAVAGFVVTAICWAGLHLVAPILARKLMALASVMVFPILSCLLVMKPQRRSIGQSIISLLVMCAISWIGAIIMVALLSDVLFMLKLDQFTGVKIAHVIPVAVVPFVLYIWRENNMGQAIKQLLEQAITYKWGILAGIVVVAGVIYISRTGNTTAELSMLESMMRDFLNDVMGVRPRSKEFLIGYPLTLLLFYYGATRQNWILTIPAVIGQVSLVNTYAHIHTFLSASLMRSVNGLILGLMIGLIAIFVVRLLVNLWNRLINS